MTPSSGLRYPVTMFTNVVLPAPLAPMMPTVSPAAISTVTLSAATTAPKRLSNPLAANSGALTRPVPRGAAA